MLALCLTFSPAAAQQPTGAAALGDLVEGLGVNTRVLMIGAHPDDEDTNLIAWLARGRHVETAYLSLTRGEGGQNLIGDELGVALGQIRTEELLAARRVDGGHQYFTRALDFGFSKTYAETAERWPKAVILRDVVSIIREFRPQVIVSVWTGTPADGHGHHQYAGVIAREAFIAAADPSYRTPGQAPWAAAKFYRSARGQPASAGTVKFNVGEYDALLGRSYAELAAISRSQHLSQGMGMVSPLGAVIDAVRLDTSRVGLTAATDTALFAGIDTSWARFADVERAKRPYLDSMLVEIRRLHDESRLARPDAMVPGLARVVHLANYAGGLNCHAYPLAACNADADYGLAIQATYERASRALLLAAGVSVDAYASRERVAAGDSVDVTVALYNRGRRPVAMTYVQVNVDTASTPLLLDTVGVAPDSTRRITRRAAVPSQTTPWWLDHGIDTVFSIYEFPPASRTAGVPAEMLRGEDRLQWSGAHAIVSVAGTSVEVNAPIVYRFGDPAFGERRRPLAGVPAISTRLESSVEYARANAPFDRDIRVEVASAWSRPDTVRVELTLPPGLRTDSAARLVVLPAFGKTSVVYRVRGTLAPGAYGITASATDRTGSYYQGYTDVLYDHINPVRFYQPPAIRLEAVDVKVPANTHVAYLRGVGDNVPAMLEQLGLRVTAVSPEAIATLDPALYSALVIGPRAFEASDAARAAMPSVIGFARRGGTVVEQYQQIANQPGVLPYPVTLARPADRVTDEKAAVSVLRPDDRLLNQPNQISARDFVDWVQERALYMPGTFAPQWNALLRMKDPGEPTNDAAILVAPVGKGTFVYTTLSFFRQLPAGNPGAARLFVNLLSAGQRTIPNP
jgi:LmbE family N-acetylglucosaminyl deacetylase